VTGLPKTCGRPALMSPSAGVLAAAPDGSAGGASFVATTGWYFRRPPDAGAGSIAFYRLAVWKARYAGLRLPLTVTTPDCQPWIRRSSRIRNHTNMSIRRVFFACAIA
jgi:hypothetical protein